MMRRTNNTHNRLLKIAKREFYQKGFCNVSMRDISIATNMALGNIYYYYKKKDALYKAILSPVLHKLMEYMEMHNDSQLLLQDIFCMEEGNFQEYVNSPRCTDFFNMLIKHREDLYMLFFLSGGSSLEHYSEELQTYLVEMGYDYLDKCKRAKGIEVQVDKSFMTIYASMMIALTKEIVRQRNMPIKELKNLYIQFCLFSMNGWKTLMGI